MNLSSINKLFNAKRYQEALMEYQNYSFKDSFMSKSVIFNQKLSSNKLQQHLKHLARGVSSFKEPTDKIVVPWLFTEEVTTLEVYDWYRLDYVVLNEKNANIDPTKIPCQVGYNNQLPVEIHLPFRVGELQSLIFLAQPNIGNELYFEGVDQVNGFAVGYSISKVSSDLLNSLFVYKFSDLIKQDVQLSIELIVNGKSLSDCFDNFDSLLENYLLSFIPTSDEAYLAFSKDQLSKVLASKSSKNTPASTNSVAKSNVSLVNNKADLSGVNFFLEGLNIIGETFVVHGWLVDLNSQIKSMSLVNPIQELAYEFSQKNVRFDRPDVVDAFKLSPTQNKLGNGFASAFNSNEVLNKDNEYYFELSTKDGKTYREKVKAKVLPYNQNSLLHLLGAIPNQDIDSNKCKNFLAPIFKSFTDYIKYDHVDESYYGPISRSPELSIVIPLFGPIRFEITQIPVLSSLALVDVEVIFAVDDPSIVDIVNENVSRLSSLYGLGVRVIWPDKNLGFSGINNLGANLAKGKNILFLNSDCFITEQAPIVKAQSWLKNIQSGAVGFRLLYSDKSVQHDGMSVSKWNGSSDFYLNDHPNIGTPINLIDGLVDKYPSSMLTAACLMISKELFIEVGGFNTSYYRGDFEDSDLCLKIIARNRKLGIVRADGIYHLERQTIVSQDPGLRQTITLVNSFIYSQRWKSLLAKKLPKLEVVK
jgi:GT2 family glycosyltransferase